MSWLFTALYWVDYLQLCIHMIVALCVFPRAVCVCVSNLGCYGWCSWIRGHWSRGNLNCSSCVPLQNHLTTLELKLDFTECLQSGVAECCDLFWQVVDLLIAMTRSACASGRRDVIFSPYPTVVDPTKSTELALNPKVIHVNYMM